MVTPRSGCSDYRRWRGATLSFVLSPQTHGAPKKILASSLSHSSSPTAWCVELRALMSFTLGDVCSDITDVHWTRNQEPGTDDKQCSSRTTLRNHWTKDQELGLDPGTMTDKIVMCISGKSTRKVERVGSRKYGIQITHRRHITIYIYVNIYG